MYIIYNRGFLKTQQILIYFKITIFLLQVVLKIVKIENRSEIFNNFAVRK